ncbi:PucR family transcriptional regulator [Carboxydocella sp. ULO1]|uniref:PucR family transcriptional regulator n=1 Tax=Carboxydocella sp. ULO1 TaxID=1926599 RepID=UPI0009AE3EF0|nr:PucR family transcriptional regulator ligand-binding domain-containing protein [Carboxydocella sp. ULO1]GAW27556.1 PucR family transcriptional regulator [Carboxydocella sp. ULO1]
MGLSIAEMLQSESLNGLRLIAGSRGKHRVIEKVSVLEIPKGYEPYLTGGELILTTFYSLRDDLNGQLETIKKFSDAGVAALGIHPVVTGMKIHEKVIENADYYGLPLILLPHTMSYAKIFYEVLGLILNRQSLILKKSEEINREFTRVVLLGSDVNTIAATLARLIKKPVLFTNDLFEFIAVSASSDEHDSFLKKCIQTSDFLKTLNLIKSTKHKIRYRIKEEQFMFKIEVEGQLINQVVVPAGESKYPYGYIFTWEIEQSLQELDFIALAHASNAFALEMAKQRAVVEAEKRYRSDFLSEVLEGKFTKEEELYRRAQLIGLNLAQKHMLIASSVA